jgi:hypothetical protein
VLAGCGDDDATTMDDDAGAECLATLSLDCSPTYPPKYDLIFENLLQPTCGMASNCHLGPEDKAPLGLVLSNRDDAYDYLLGKKPDHRARVIPNKPECSILVKRLESDNPSFRMPVGMDPLPESDRCAVRQWIANGAER